MKIGGLQKLSLIDFPGRPAAVIFTQGCNFRCSYCQNPELVLPGCFCPDVGVEKVLAFLHTRRRVLSGVVVSGGEPTLHGDLQDFLFRIKSMGFALKLDTNGSRPEVLRRLLDEDVLDYVAMDIKSSLTRYHDMIQIKLDIRRIEESVHTIIHSGIDHEFRTTLVKPYCDETAMKAIHQLIRGARRHRLQAFQRGEKMVAPERVLPQQLSPQDVTRLKSRWEFGLND